MNEFDEFDEFDGKVPVMDKRRFNEKGEKKHVAAEEPATSTVSAAEIALEAKLKVETERREEQRRRDLQATDAHQIKRQRGL